MIPIDDKMVSRVGDILDKLDALNKKIITKYFVLIRDKKYNPPIELKNFSDDLTYIDFRIKDQISWKKADVGKYYEKMVQSNLPYYYKIINLYVHLCAILDTIEDINDNITLRNMKKLISNKYFTIQYNVFNSFDTPMKIAREQFNDKDWKKGSLVNEYFQFIEAEIRKLMFIANNLNSEIQNNKDLRISPKGTKDYDYMAEYERDVKDDFILDAPQWGDTSTWFNPEQSQWVDINKPFTQDDFEKLKEVIETTIEDSCVIPPDKLPLKSNDIWSTIMSQAPRKIKTVEELKQEQLNKMQEEELKKLYTMFSLKLMSQKEYYAKVNEVMNKYRQGNIVIPAVYPTQNPNVVDNIDDILKQTYGNKKTT